MAEKLINFRETKELYSTRRNPEPASNIIFNRKLEESNFQERARSFESLSEVKQFDATTDLLSGIREEKQIFRREIFDFGRVEEAPFVPDIPLLTPTTPPLTEEERARLSLSRRTAKLKNPHMQSLLRFVRATPHLWDQIQGFQQRREQLLQNTTENGDTHRQFAPLLAGIAVIPESRAYLQIALDEAANQESDALKRQAETADGYYTPVLVVGAGIHGSIFNAQLLNDRPDVRALTVDQEDRLGGNFRKPNGPAFRTNSRNRAEDRTQEGLPGTDGNINSMGKYAPMQIADTSGEVYTDNDTFGLVTALNQYLSGDTMLGVKLREVERNSGGDGKYRVTLEDQESRKTLSVTTDMIVTASGLGESDTALTEGLNTPQVLTYEEFMEMVGDRENQFPLEQFVGKKIAVVGKKDSGNTAVEQLLGLASEYRGSVAQMGKPGQIVWYGPDFITQEDYKECTRGRYSQIGLFLPKVAGEDSPLQTRSGKVTRLRETDDGKVVVSSPRSNSLLEDTEEYDYVIVSTGFKDNKADIFKKLISTSGIFRSRNDNFEKNLVDVTNVDSGGNDITIARKLAGEDIYFVGPAANIPVSDADRQSIQGLEVPENSVAIWRYSEKTAATARKVGMSLERQGERVMPIQKAPVQEGDQAENGMEYALPEELVSKNFPPEINYADLLKMRALAQGAPSEGVDQSDLSFTVKKVGSESRSYVYAASVNGESTDEQQRWVQGFVSDALNQRVLAKLARGSSGSVTVSMPMDGTDGVDGIEVSTRSRRASQ